MGPTSEGREGKRGQGKGEGRGGKEREGKEGEVGRKCSVPAPTFE